MSLTYQPFAEVPEISELGATLHQNVPETERTVSALSGAAIIAASLMRDGPVRLVLMAAGAALLWRGWTGHCPLYEQIEVSRSRAQNA